jgi:hypothetical protein
MGITCSKSDFNLLRFAWFGGGGEVRYPLHSLLVIHILGVQAGFAIERGEADWISTAKSVCYFLCILAERWALGKVF